MVEGSSLSFFFFQAEDGIRDVAVTGVQTCALPISFGAAAANANWAGTPGFGVIITNEPGAASWPIAGATFILVHKQPSDPAAAAAALKFFNWAYAKGGKMAEDLDYVPRPPSV